MAQKNSTLLMADIKTSLQTGLRNRKTWNGIFKLMKERSVLRNRSLSSQEDTLDQPRNSDQFFVIPRN